MQKIKKIAKNKSIKILEDNCEFVGGKYGKNFWEMFQILEF